MNPRILNRAGKLPDDGFYQIEALGEHINHAARVVQVIDAQAVESIVNRFAAEAAKAGDDFPGLPLDKDHLSQSLENSTEALGWAMQLRNRAGVPEAKIGWTGLGLPLVEAKEGQPPAYKFFSTEYEPAECEQIGTRKIGNRDYKIVRPLRLAGLSLTNDPNNKGQRPISNRQGNSADAGNHQPDTPMKSALKELGLAEDAPEASAVAEIQKIKNRATSADTEVVALKKERDELLAAQVDSDLEKYKNRFKPENRDKVKAQLVKNRAGAIELLEMTEPAAAVATAARITNRAAALTPADKQARQEDPDGKLAARISNRALEIQKQKSVRGRAYPYQTAFNDAKAELSS